MPIAVLVFVTAAVRSTPARRPAVKAAAPAAPGRLLPVSRAGVVILFVLAVANGVFLYLFPGEGATHYAWSIKPPISAAFLGAGFLAGTVPTALVVLVTHRWRSLRTLPPALFVLAASLLAATLLHAGRFRWGYPLTWGWLAVYATVPFGVAVLWHLQERDPEPAPAPHPALRGARLASAVAGGVLVAGAVLLFAAPVDLARHWPWELAPLMARAVACWYAMIGVLLLACARSLRGPQEAILPYATVLAWSVLLLLLPALHGDDVARHGAELTGWITLMAALAALSLYGLARAVPAARAEARHL